MTQPNYQAQELTIEQCDKVILILKEKLRSVKLRRKALVSREMMKRNMQNPEFKARWQAKLQEARQDPVKMASWRENIRKAAVPNSFALPPMTAAQREHYYRLRKSNKKLTREEALRIVKSAAPLPSMRPAPAAISPQPQGSGGNL